MNCNLTPENCPIVAHLYKVTGTDIVLYANYLTTVFEGSDYSDKFKDWHKSKFNAEPDINSTEHLVQMTNRIKQFYLQNTIDVKNSSKINRNDSDTFRLGYTSELARTEAHDNAISFALLYYMDIMKQTGKTLDDVIDDYNTQRKNQYDQQYAEAEEKPAFKKVSKKEYIASVIDDEIQNELYFRLSDAGMSDEDIDKAFANNDTAAMEEIFGKNISTQDANFLALYKESLADRDTFYTKLFRSQKLNDLKIDNSESVSEDKVMLNLENQDDEDVVDDDDTTDGSKDKSIEEYNSHSGEFTSFLKHLDNPIKNYFNSLFKLKNTEFSKDDEGNILYNRDTATETGIAKTMNYSQVSTILYSFGDFQNVDAMVNSLKTIANTVPGYASFIKIYNDCLDDYNLAYKIYNIFGKWLVEKTEAVKDDSKSYCRVSNRSSDKQTTLRFEFLNSIKFTAINVSDYNATEINQQSIAIDKNFDIISKKKNVTASDPRVIKYKAQAVQFIHDNLKKYYPTIDEYAISNYITNNVSDSNVSDVQNIRNNITTLSGLLIETINNAKDTYVNYMSKIADINSARYNNEKNGNSEEAININELYARSYVSEGSQSAAFRLADQLVKYTAVKVELNGKNVLGKATSNVINNNMISNLMNTLQNELALNNYGDYKSKTRQYDLSNILIEHKDEKGNIINYGLFTKDSNGSFIPTEYASELLSGSLFDGASDLTSDNNILYKKMSSNDYTITAFINFFNSENNYKSSDKTKSIDFANYFMRTPSDAPKNFMIRAPKYTIKSIKGSGDLFKISDNAALITYRQSIYNTIPRLREDSVLPEVAKDKSILRSVKDAASDILSTTTKPIAINNFKSIIQPEGVKNYKPKVGDKCQIRCCYYQNADNYTSYIMEGTYAQSGNGYVLSEPKLVGVADDYINDLSTELNTRLEHRAIREGVVNRQVNTQHPLFLQFKQAFVQELTDAATALDTFFVNENGLIKSVQEKDKAKKDKGKYCPLFKEGFDNSEKCGKTLYALYHVDKSNKIYNEETYKLTGNVFKSDRFTIMKQDGSFENYGETILNKAFEFFPINSTDKYIHTVQKEHGVEVQLTEEQERIINEELQRFIIDYVRDYQDRMGSISDMFSDSLQSIYNYTNIATFALNYHLMYINFGDLFEGDTKFYKPGQDFFKRAKESQASGIPYGIVNYNEKLNADKTIIEEAPLSKTTFTHKTAESETPVNIKQYNRFRAVTIKNTVRTGNTIGEFKYDKAGNITGFKTKGILAEQLINSFIQEGFTKELSEKKALNILSKYDSTKVNDAQSYITFEEWVRRISARGQLDQYKELIIAILDETKSIDSKTIKQFVQVQKNFYYDQYYNERLHVIAPRQIKNAEFVLVPRLIKGTQLEEVYNLMKENYIDQLNTVETSKAGKCNVLTIWDNNGEITESNINDFKANVKGASELFSYNYLYTQQETPQHMNAENKAGIQLMKKIIDNIPDDPKHPLYKYKKQFISCYCGNIKDSFNKLLKELKVETDENGNIKLNEAGNISGLDFQILFDKFVNEFERQGLDSNALDYVTLIDNPMFTSSTGEVKPTTRMPMFMSMFSTKAESVAQSVINNNITRQKLKGFHAPQITNIGWQYDKTNIKRSKDLQYHPLIYVLEENGKRKEYSEEEYNKLDDSIKSKCKKEAAAYIEIRLPKSCFNFKLTKSDGTVKTDEELLKELQDEGLDYMIGYRIPTEGKQSICIMKLKGFVDDTYGSTIVVPDDWVSQTGSDFDVDSVYGINYSTYIGADGKIKKYKYKESVNEYDWYNYVVRTSKERFYSLDDDLYNKYKELAKTETKEEIKNKLKEEKNSKTEEQNNIEQEVWLDTPDSFKDYIKALHDAIKKLPNYKTANDYEKFVFQLYEEQRAITDIFNNHIDEYTQEELEAINNYATIRKEILDSLTSETTVKTYDYKSIKQEKLNSLLNKYKEERKQFYTNIAKRDNLLSLEDYLNQDIIAIQSRDSRSNGILDAAINILSNIKSLEENLSASGFTDLIDARDELMPDIVKNRRKHRSNFNFLDQANQQEDAMSGAMLKGLSVMRDSFCSICNNVKPTVSNLYAPTIIYSSRNGFTQKELEKSFDNVKVIKTEDKDGKYKLFSVKHNSFGWTKNNRNVAGKLLTCYSSQTTAHILDAIKEGPIPNVNDLTFQVYKLFPDLGSDYKTCEAFIMQPGIERIIQAYNETKSIYVFGNKNPINSALSSIIKDIYKVIGMQYKPNTKLEDVLQQINIIDNGFVKSLFKVDNNFAFSLDSKTIFDLPIDSDILKDRLKNEGIFANNQNNVEIKKLLFDLATVLQYRHLSKFASSVLQYASVCNPDKFGAKQSIYATNQVFDTINELSNEQNPALSVKDKHILSTIYPDVNKGLDDYIKSTNMDSTYPSLHYFLKYATATSVKLNRTLFETQDPLFVQQISSLKELFTGTKRQLTEDEYKDFLQYILTDIYCKTDAVSKLITVNKEGNFVYKADTNLIEEKRRIFGFGKEPNHLCSKTYSITKADGTVETITDKVPFECEDINNPSDEEIDTFLSFSPAQKISWIKAHSNSENIFTYIDCSLFNENYYRVNRGPAQTISFVENSIDTETAYNLFNEAYYNNNPLIALAAMDIIKYAFAVEGFKLRKKGVSKIISNAVLYNDAEHNGTNIVNQIQSEIKDIASRALNIETIKNNYIRSHSSTYKIATHKIDKKDKAQFSSVVIPVTVDGKPINMHSGLILINKDSLSDTTFTTNYDITYYDSVNNTHILNDFVKIKEGRKITLYKIKESINGVYLIPLNKLEENENSEFSINNSNNKYRSEVYYNALIEKLEENTEKSLSEINALYNNDAYKSQNTNTVKNTDIAKPFNINDDKFSVEKDKIVKYFSNNNGILYIISNTLKPYITAQGAANGSSQFINGIQYDIIKMPTKTYNSRYIGPKKENREIKEDSPELNTIIEQARQGGYPVMSLYAVAKHINVISANESSNDNSVRRSAINELPPIEKFANQSMRALYRKQNDNDKDAYEAYQTLSQQNITIKDGTIKQNLDKVIAVNAEYIQNATTQILNNLNYFTKNADNEYIPITDPEVIELIKTNKNEQNRFLKTLLNARAFVKNYNIIDELDLNAYDDKMKHDLSIIKKCINDLKNASIINNAENIFATEFLAKLSNNPNIKSDIISILDGFHSASSFDAWVNDLQETSNPLLQIITKDVMADIRGKELKALDTVRKVKTKIEDIKKRAKEEGLSVDWKNIIDDTGKFIQEYDNSLLDKRDELVDNIRVAKNKLSEAIDSNNTEDEYKYGIKALKAEFEYNKFKYNHFHQELIDNYYQRKLLLEKSMIERYPSIYYTYKKLSKERQDINSHAINGVLSEEYQEKLKEVNNKIKNLTSLYYSDGVNYIEKYSVNDPDNPLKDRAKLINSKEAAEALNSYLDDIRDLNKEFYTYDAKYGFYEELEKNLDIVERRESRDPNGRIRTPMSELMQDEVYVKAKKWLATNARHVVTPEIKELIDKAIKTLKDKKYIKGNKSFTGKLLSQYATQHDAYDEFGVIDGRLFTDSEIKELKQEQLRRYNLAEGSAYQDTLLISNAPTTNVVFSNSFYNSLKNNTANNADYIKLVKDANDILSKYYDNATKTVYTSSMSTQDISNLQLIYSKMSSTHRHVKSEKGRYVAAFIKGSCDIIYDYAKYEEQKRLAEQQGGDYSRQWEMLNTTVELANNGDILLDSEGKAKKIPNPFLYGHLVPKGYKFDGSGNNDLVDKDRTEAINILYNYTTTNNTEYYYDKFKEMSSKGKAVFDTWYHNNHVYNPYNHVYEPLPCWTKMEINPMVDDGDVEPADVWVPAFAQTKRRPKNGKDVHGNPITNPNDENSIDYTNHKWKKDAGLAANYKDKIDYITDDFSEFENNTSLEDHVDYTNKNNKQNKYEKELKQEVQNILYSLATVSSAKRFLDRGYMVSKRKGEEVDSKFIAKEVAKFWGWIEGATGRESWYNDIDYANDKTIDMPMTSLFKSKESIKLENTPPNRKDFKSDAEYNDALADYKKQLKEAKQKAHAEALDNNWEDVLSDFIIKASHFNAIQDNKYMIFYAKNMLDKLDVYSKNVGFNNLRIDSLNGTETNPVYITKKDDNLKQQYANWIRRLVYNQYKKPNNGFTRAGNIMQSLTSAKFMMLNVTGGIANYTVGSTQIIAERFAKEYFGNKNWYKASTLWKYNINNFLLDSYSDKSSSLVSAIIKFMNVVDFDEITGSVTIPNASEYIKRARDIMFSPQTIGEHFMQNTAMLAMMDSHRLYIDPNTGNYTYKNIEEITNECHEQALLSIISDKQKDRWAEFKKYSLNNANNIKEYAWFRKDLVTEYANIYLSKEDKAKLVDKLKELKNVKEKEFYDDSKHPTIYSQLELGSDGKLSFKNDSILLKMGDDAYSLLGAFKGRVISVNKKIHGVYDKLGAAQIESEWWGGIVMQYHKHLYPGIMKRYRRQGYFNEERGTIEKGCYASIKDFLALPLHKRAFADKIKNDNNMSESELQNIQGIQTLIKDYIDFAINIKLNYKLLPDSEKNNIKRVLGDLLGITSALCMAIALNVAMGDDDDDNLLYNLFIYESDRLASESMMWYPWGLAAEGKKLWSSPVAVENGIDDCIHSLGFVCQWLIQGDEFDPYYSSGLYAGENKLEIMLKRQIPMYHGVNMLTRLNRNNKYYKLNENILSIIPVKDIADYIRK